MAYTQSGTHLVIARSPEEAARNVLTYPYSFGEDSDSAAIARLEGVRDKFGQEYDVFLVHTKVSVDERVSDLLDSPVENDT